MIKYLTLQTGLMGANTYIVYNEGEKTAVVIDAGGDYDLISLSAFKQGLEIKALLLTHGHFDHMMGAGDFQKDGIPVYICQQEAHMLGEHRDNLARAFGVSYNGINADFTFRGGDVLTFGNLSFKVILTPGHTVGSCCFLCDNVCFSGDTLFCESVGRTDFPGGNHTMLMQSIKEKLFTLPDDTVVCPGHNEQTTISHEKMFNPYVGEGV